MATFSEIFDSYDWFETRQSIHSKTGADVEQALHKKTKRSLEDFKALISPAAFYYVEEMAQISHQLTQKRFGKTVQMFVPMYLSNECKNICTYCAFSYDNKIKRVTLDEEQILREVSIIKQMGFDHILIVTGEDNKNTGVEYLKRAIEIIRPYFSHISIEVQPLEQEEYEELIPSGLNTVLVYQETYNKNKYRDFHPKGKKSNFYYRLETPDRLGKAGIYKIGLGVLLGLEDPDEYGAGWRTDSFFCAAHLAHLEKIYWQTKFSVSFPRLRPIHSTSPLQLPSPLLSERSPTQGEELGVSPMTDKELVQLICAYRIFNEELELSISTRESEKFRNNIIKLGVTSISAGSKTNPGGYSVEKESLEQFEISDERTPLEISEMIHSQGYVPVWKDWDKSYQLTTVGKSRKETLKQKLSSP